MIYNTFSKYHIRYDFTINDKYHTKYDFPLFVI